MDGWWGERERGREGEEAYVPVFPERARVLWIMSREVPKSESIARGLYGRNERGNQRVFV